MQLLQILLIHTEFSPLTLSKAADILHLIFNNYESFRKTNA